MDTYLSIDLGGTKLLIGEVNSDGKILRYKKYPTGRLDQNQAAELICESLDDYIENVGWSDLSSRPEAIGVGLLGRVDNKSGIWLQIDPERTTPVALADNLSERFGLPCYIDNDVKSATRAEMLWGAGKISDNYIYINVGTGIACGTVVDRRLIRGSHFNAGEVGHTVTCGVNVGIRCACGRVDCVETLAAGIGFDYSARILSKTIPTGLYIPEEGTGRVSVAEVFQLCETGDELCVKLVDNAARALAGLVMNLARTSDPDTIVLGGGVVASGYLLEKMQPYLIHSALRFVSGGILLSKLDPSFMGLLGAAAVAIGN